MAAAGRAEDLPLELIARTCKDQGYFGVAEVVGREDVEAVADNDHNPTRQRGTESRSLTLRVMMAMRRRPTACIKRCCMSALSR